MAINNPMTTPESSPLRERARSLRLPTQHIEGDHYAAFTVTEPPTPDALSLADILDAFADLLEARAAKPEPSPLSEQDFETLIAWTRHEFPYDGYVDRCLHCSKQRTDGHSVSCPLLLTKRLIAQARAARPWWLWQPIETAPKDMSILVSDGVDVWQTHLGNVPYTLATAWQPLPAPPAQDGGQP